MLTKNLQTPLLGTSSPTRLPTMALPLDPAGDFRPIDSLLCPPNVETDRWENAKLSKTDFFSFGIDNVHTP